MDDTQPDGAVRSSQWGSIHKKVWNNEI